MKKLLAILVIVMLAVPMFAGTDILNFMWFNNTIGMSFADGWNLPSANVRTGGTGTQHNAEQLNNGGNWYGFLEQFMCGMWGTAYDGDPVKIKMDFFNYFNCAYGDWGNNNVLQLNEQIRFKGVIEVGSIYTLAVGGKGFIRLFPLGGHGDANKLEPSTDPADPAGTLIGTNDVNQSGMVELAFIGASLLLENTIKIPNVLNISLNGEFQWVQWGNGNNGDTGWTGNFNALNAADAASKTGHTDFNIYIDAAIGNSYSFGFSWNLSQTIIIGLDLEKVAGNVPNKTDIGGTANELVTRANYSEGAQPNYFTDVPFFKTQLDLSQNILSLAGIKDISLTASIDQNISMMLPYTGNQWELTKLINTQGQYGLTIGFYGFSIGAFFTLATQDSYNTSVPVDTDAAGGGVLKAWSHRCPGRGQLGILLKWGYSRGFFGFEMSYLGQGQFRDYDYNKDNWASVAGSNWSHNWTDHGGIFRGAGTYERWENIMFININFSW